MKKQFLVYLLISITVLCGCSGKSCDSNELQSPLVEMENSHLDNFEVSTQEEEKEPNSTAPSKNEVLTMRTYVLAGMTEEEIQRLTETIKSANLQMETGYLWKNNFESLEDPESLTWNYFYEEGEIQIGWATDWPEEECEAMWKEEGLTEQEFYEKYAVPVKVHNNYDAESYIELLKELQKTVNNEELQHELQNIIDEISLAAAKRDVKHVRNAYKILHDMDYYLLRYGPEDVAKFVDDDSTIMEYYGAMGLYN